MYTSARAVIFDLLVYSMHYSVLLYWYWLTHQNKFRDLPRDRDQTARLSLLTSVCSNTR